ncbi:hypothetical protein DFH06DRAFT_1347982 [Mycena polygramma]|nr:hypothetical protein DFH06DRAFT_1347982 [Mycena polygramma]
MPRKSAFLPYTFECIRRWMDYDEDSPMDSPWDDSDSFIENRCGARQDTLLTNYLATGTVNYHDQLPPFRGSNPGDNPDHHMNSQGPHSPGPWSGSVSTDDSRRHDSFSHEVELRHRASSSVCDRPRFRDEPVWDNGSRNRRPNPYSFAYEGSRSRYAQQFAAEGQQRSRAPTGAPPRGVHGPSSPPAPPCPPADPLRILDNPDLSLSPRGPDGHPMSEWAIKQAGPEPCVEDECPPSDDNYAATEEARIERARTKPLKLGRAVQPVWRDNNQRLLGRFHRCQIVTLEQAFNLISFLNAGQQEAWELYSTFTQNLAAFPLLFRTEGKAYILCHQQDIERSWWITVTGEARTPRHERHPGPSTLRRNARPPTIPGPFTPNLPMYGDRGTPNFGSHASGSTSAGATSSSSNSSNSHPPTWVMDPTRPHPRVNVPTARYGPRRQPQTLSRPRSTTLVLSPDDSQGYLGTSPPNPTDTPPGPELEEFAGSALTPNTRWTAEQILLLGGGDTARREDMLAHQTNLALAPDNRRIANHQHKQFTNAALYLFSVRGLFAHIVSVGGYPTASLSISHYRSLTDNITIFLIAAWYVQHGIVPGSPDVLALEEFARSCRNMMAGNTDITNEVWPVDEMDAVATLGYDATCIPSWTAFQHASARPDIAPGSTPGTNTAAAPSGLAASAHALTTMEDMQGMSGPTDDDKPKPVIAEESSAA